MQQTKSKHIKASTERYLLGQKHNLQIFSDANIFPSTGQENNIAQQQQQKTKTKTKQKVI